MSKKSRARWARNKEKNIIKQQKVMNSRFLRQLTSEQLHTIHDHMKEHQIETIDEYTMGELLNIELSEESEEIE